jgi:hypothetical protein
MKLVGLRHALICCSLAFALSNVRADDQANHQRGLKPKDKAAAGGGGARAVQDHKVAVYHKGHIISVDGHALNAHLAHGDAIVSGNNLILPPQSTSPQVTVDSSTPAAAPETANEPQVSTPDTQNPVNEAPHEGSQGHGNGRGKGRTERADESQGSKPDTQKPVNQAPREGGQGHGGGHGKGKNS